MPSTTGRMALIAAALAAALGAAAPAGADPAPVETISERSAADQSQGDRLAPRLAAQFGGDYADPELAAYVAEVGRRMVSVSEQADEKWSFTVLDSAAVNAFALPGGQVFVTRGLLALANSEAELAGVMGHEIGHVTAGHAASRQTRGALATGLLLGARVLGAIFGVDEELLDAGGQLGQLAAGGILADYSREDELVADRLAVRYMARAGYDPFAQADFLESLAARATLDARLAGEGGNPNDAGFFSSHPATPERARAAVALAREAGVAVAPGEGRHRARYLDAIDGIVFGDSSAQGFARGRTFSHPGLGFTFTVPEGFKIENAADAIRATGPEGARFIMDGAANPAGSLGDYLLGEWVPAIGRQFPTGVPGRVERRRINGFEAATTTLPVEIRGRRMDAVLTALRLDGALYRLAALAPRGSGLFEELEAATTSFRRLTEAEAAALVPAHLAVVTARPGDTVAALAARMRDDAHAEARFRVLNALDPDEEPRAGQRVKIVR